MTLNDGDVLGARVLSDGTVGVYVDATVKLSGNISSWAHYTKPGYIGFGWSAPTGAGVLDDFGGG